MNRETKEIKRKYDAARKGLTQDQIAAVDLEDSITEKIKQLACKIHSEKYPEEYDFMGDSCDDANRRRNGINPMSQEYIERIRKRREELGILKLAEKTGMSISGVTFKLCEAEARKQIYSDLGVVVQT